MNNLGLIKESINKKVLNNLLSEDINLSSGLLKEFIDEIKKSEILLLENTVYSNIVSYFTTDKNLAIKYIDENLKMFNDYKKNDIISENKKILNKFINYIDNNSSNIELFNNIQTLINESTIDKTKSINKKQKAYEYITNYLITEKKVSDNISINDSINLSDIELNYVSNKVNEIINEKYLNTLSENEKNIIKILFENDETKKVSVFNTIKTDTINKLNTLLDEEPILINETINKINLMLYNDETLIDDINTLINLV